jgi:hypothetical protein
MQKSFSILLSTLGVFKAAASAAAAAAEGPHGIPR